MRSVVFINLSTALLILGLTDLTRGQEVTNAPRPNSGVEAPGAGPQDSVDACPLPDGGEAVPAHPPRAAAWGVAGLSGYFDGERTAPNGLVYSPLFSLDLDLNFWLWPAQGLYAFGQDSFWTQRASRDVTNPHQGQFDFSKREFDLTFGAAWNYCGPWEARVFAYSLNNLNRGHSLTVPDGFKDGYGLEDRLYLSQSYADLGTTEYDISRVSFLSLGYLPTKSLVGGNGDEFTPGAFARAYLACDLWDHFCYAYLDVQLTAEKAFTPKLLDTDAGLALRPLRRAQQVEFRLGGTNVWDLRDQVSRTLGYVSLRFLF
jgi:hypothetical protein